MQTYVTYDHVVTHTTEITTPDLINFAKSVTNLQAYLSRQLNYGYGINGDVYPETIGLYYIEEGGVDTCY